MQGIPWLAIRSSDWIDRAVVEREFLGVDKLSEMPIELAS
jgi:hypothetical protein